MTDPAPDSARQQQFRRTARARRGVVAAGAVGALGTAIAIGVTTEASGTTSAPHDDGTPGQSDTWSGDQGELDQQPGQDQFDQSAPDGGQLAAPGTGAPQARSGGS